MGRTSEGQRKKPATTQQQVKPGRMRQTQIRLDDALRERIDKYQSGERDRVGYEVGFSTIVRKLLEKGLDAFELEEA